MISTIMLMNVSIVEVEEEVNPALPQVPFDPSTPSLSLAALDQITYFNIFIIVL